VLTNWFCRRNTSGCRAVVRGPSERGRVTCVPSRKENGGSFEDRGKKLAPIKALIKNKASTWLHLIYAVCKYNFPISYVMVFHILKNLLWQRAAYAQVYWSQYWVIIIIIKR
jgi:hypothetical protein